MADEKPICTFCGEPSRQSGQCHGNVVQTVSTCRRRDCVMQFVRLTEDPKTVHYRAYAGTKRRRQRSRPRQNTRLTH